MYNFFVATIGKRDVQINRNRLEENNLSLVNEGNLWYIKDNASQQLVEIDAPGNSMSSPNQSHYVIKQPRTGGDIIRFNQSFQNACDLPIISPVIEKILVEEKNLKIVKLVHTDQDNIDYRNGDTLYFSSIIKKYLEQNHNLDVDEYKVLNSPADIDIQYADFKHKRSQANTNLLPANEEVRLIYLLVQGGMDQINFALTLRLMENYRGKLIYLQKPEKSGVIQRQFPIEFIKNLTRNQIISLIRRREFIGPQTLLISETLIHLCKLAQATIDLNYIAIDELIMVDLSKPCQFYDNFRNEYITLSKSKKILLLLFASLKNDFFKQDPNGMVWKFQTLAEQMFRPEVEQILELNSDATDNQISDAVKSPRFQYLLRFILKQNKDLKDKIEKKPTTVIKSDYKLYASIIKFNLQKKSLANNSIHFQMIKAFDRIKDRRVKLIHYGHFSTMEDLSKKLLLEEKSIKELINLISTYLGSMGITRKTSRIIDQISEFTLTELTS